MNRPRTTAQLREWLAKELRRRVDNALWHHLETAAFIEGALDSSEPQGLDDLLDEAKKFSALIRGSRPGRKRRGPTPARVRALIPKEEALRSQVLSNYLARVAAYTPEVRRFRRELLAGKTLTRKQAGILLDSEAPRFFTWSFFKSHAIPLVGHQSWIVYYDEKGNSIPLYSFIRSSLEIEWPKGKIEVPYTVEQFQKLSSDRTPRLEILARRFTPLPPARGFHRGGMTSVLPGSIFDELRQVSIRLTEAFGWQEGPAAWFVLSGIPPISRPIEVHPEGALRGDHHRLHLRITVEPWVSPKTLLGVYKYVQRESTGRQSHRFSERNLLLVDKVSELIDRHEPMPSWRELMRMWNEAHPELAYDHPQRFHRDYVRTVTKLVFPGYLWPFFWAQKKTQPMK